MRRNIKKSLAFVLALIFTFGSFTAFAAGDVDLKEKEYYDYGSYVLLGDSVASGWSDVVEKETRFVRVEGSYGAHVADDLGVVYHPMACIGFRTVELRYIFEDDFEGDRFLFYSIDDEEMEWRIPLIRKAVAEAGLITLNVGGNDWGSYVGWHVFEEMDKLSGTENFVEKALPYLENNENINEETIESLIDLADFLGCLPQLVSVLPKALEEGFRNYIYNWNYMIEDIYALNPDVTLIVIGMFDNMVQNQETADRNEAALIKLSLSQAIVDYANKPMIEGAEKYGYTFIDTKGTVCEQNHPSAEGHRYIADKILEALPDARFPYTDVQSGTADYKTVEKVHFGGIMSGTGETTFSPEASLTKAQFAEALYNISGAPEVIAASFGDVSADDEKINAITWANEEGILTADGDGNFTPDEEVSKLKFATVLFKYSINDGFLGFFKGVSLMFRIILNNLSSINSSIDRITAAGYFVQY